MTIADVKTELNNGVSVRTIIEQAIKRANEDTHHAILSIVKERALQRADEIDGHLKANKPVGRLAGVPFLAKDNILTFDSTTTAASHMLENFRAPYQATIIQKLESEGAICIGKTNLDAFAHGGSTENSYFGPTSNIMDQKRVAGGSSGGSAVAVASGIVPFALGTDTGGSIRQPASFNGVVGLKPTYGTVSRYGIVAMASSTDVAGPIATTVEDVELVFNCMKGIDPNDSTTTNTNIFLPTSNLKIGIIKQFMGEGVDDEVKQLCETMIEKYKAAGHIVQEIDLPTINASLGVYYIVVPAELTSNLARFDGVKYGLREDGASLSEMYANTRSNGFMSENKRRILIGNYVLSSGYYDAYYRKAQTVRTKIINEFAAAFQQVDVLIGPVAPSPAFLLGENTSDPLQMYLADIMTVPASLAGLSAISLPVGKTNAGLPVGLQIMGPMREDERVLAVAHEGEKLNG